MSSEESKAHHFVEIANLSFSERAAALARLADELEERLESLNADDAGEEKDEWSSRR